MAHLKTNKVLQSKIASYNFDLKYFSFKDMLYNNYFMNNFDML